MPLEIRTLTLEDYEPVLALWRACEGVGLSADDSRAGIERHLARNPGLSFIALDGDRVAGAVLCSHDGRRGYLTHLAVAKEYRRRGVGEALAGRCLEALRQLGISKCHIFVFVDNENARAFWRKTGWIQRDELVVMSKMVG
jgi:ribosomal protein S18 acetylase RimI-like enzyme